MNPSLLSLLNININKIIDLSDLKPISFKQFSVTIVPATVSAFGFDLEKVNGDSQNEAFSQIDWFMLLKFANASNNSLIIENIEAECIGRHGYRCKSNNFLTQVYQTNEEKESNVIEKLLKDDMYTESQIFFPFLLKGYSEKIVRVDFVLKTYKKKFFKLKPISFKRKDIKEPDTYEDLFRKAIIKIKINESSRPLLLKL